MQPAATIAPGQIGAYRLVRQIGAGGMGAVWLAEHAMLGRRAAVKVLHPVFTAQPEVVTRFFNEARAASTIADPGIVQIFDYGHHVDGSAYIVMELLEGEPLDKRLARTGKLAVADALRVIRQVAASLAAAHTRGIVHRDLKPENIFLTPDAEVAGGERAKLLDFGIAKLSADGDAGVKTQTYAVLGTPLYMSPEQCRGAGGVDQRSDVYALGCVLFMLIAGEPPFAGDGIGEIIAMHLREPAPRLAARAPWVPHELDEAVARCLAKDPDERFASATELAAVLDGIKERISVTQVTPSSSIVSARSATTTLSAGALATRNDHVRSGGGRVVLAAGGSTALALVVFLAMARGGDSPAVTIDAPPVAVAAIDAAPPEPPPAVTLVVVDERPARAREQLARLAATRVACTTRELDPWARPIRVTCTRQRGGTQITAMSSGEDGRADTADDLTSSRFSKAVPVVPESPAPTLDPTPTPEVATPTPEVPTPVPSPCPLDDRGPVCRR
jgi:serine/threonine-protein kinase